MDEYAKKGEKVNANVRFSANLLLNYQFKGVQFRIVERIEF